MSIYTKEITFSSTQPMADAFPVLPNEEYRNIGWTVQLKGAIDYERLQQSVSSLTSRLGIRPITFSDREGQTVRFFSPEKMAVFSPVNLNEAEGEPESLLPALLETEAGKPLDPVKGPLLRVLLVRRNATDVSLHLRAHGAFMNELSLPVCLRELLQRYQSVNGEYTASPLPDDQPLQTGPHPDILINRASSPELGEERAYWKRTLADLPPVLDFPPVRSRVANPSPWASYYSFTLEPSLTDALKQLSASADIPLFPGLLAAFTLLLSRYGRTQDIPVAIPVANCPETGDLLESVANTVIVRCNPDSGLSFREWTRRVNELLIQAVHHGRLPFGEIGQAWGTGEQPFPQIRSVWQEAFPAGDQTSSLIIHPEPFQYEARQTGLQLSWYRGPEGLKGTFYYNPASFEENTIRGMANHLKTLLQAAVLDPEIPAVRLPLLTEPEKHQLLVDRNQTQVPYSHDQSVHALFEAQVNETPGAVAVVFEGRQITYRELNERANQVAHYLQSLGVGPEVMVGICLDRSVELVVGLLGIIKAGGAFVPLETGYPKERLVYMLEDTRVSILLTSQASARNLPEGITVNHTVRLDQDWATIAAQPAANPDSGVRPDNLIYVMYTSGSTGKPKGVAAVHRGVVRLVKGANYVRLDENETFLLMAPVAFDASTFEIWGCLCNGGKLVVMPPQHPAIPEIKQVIRENGVTTLWLTAGLFHLMADSGLEQLTSLRQVLAGGDALSLSHVKKVFEAMPDCTFINGYGPTENTTFTCCEVITEEDLRGSSVPIGLPISNTEVYILDEYGQLVPAGVPGELYTGGAGLARGYLNKPELTAEKFVPNPFSQDPGARLYRTGDLVRYLPNGKIEFMGRLDNQVKIRGYRIELGEIEQIISQHPDVKEVTVIVREFGPGDKRLLAYVVPHAAARVDVTPLKEYVREQLPQYMVPSAFVLLETLPLTTNGKVDRKALPLPGDSGGTEEGYEEPRTSTEKALASIWAEALKTHKVGIRDNFFEMGGHSLLAGWVVVQIQERMSHLVPLSLLFANPTIASLAPHLENGPSDTVWNTLVAVVPADHKPPLICLHPVSGDIEYVYKMTPYLDPDQPVYGIMARGINGAEAPFADITEAADYYLQAIREKFPRGPYHLAGYSYGGLVAYEIAQRLVESGQEVQNLILFDTYPTNVGRNYREFAVRYVVQSTLHLIFSIENIYDFYRNQYWRGLLKKSISALKIIASRLKLYKFQPVQYPETLAGPGGDRKKILDYLIFTLAKSYGNYQVKPYPGKIVFIRAVEGAARYLRNSDMGWSRFAKKGVAVYDVLSANHFTLFEHDPQVREVAQIVQRYLDGKGK